MFKHVLEEIFLHPSAEHGRRQPRAIGDIIGADDGGLVASVGQPADLSCPDARALEEHTALGEEHLDRLSLWSLTVSLRNSSMGQSAPGILRYVRQAMRLPFMALNRTGLQPSRSKTIMKR